MAVTKVDGFEHGSVVASAAGIYDGAQGTPAIVTSPVRSGARALEISTSGAAAERVIYDFVAAVQQPAASFYIRFASLPAAVVTLAAFNNANGPGMFQYDNTAGRFAVSNNNAGRTSVGPTVATNTWYQIDLKYDSSTGTVAMSAAIDGGSPVTASRSQVASDATTMHLGSADPASPVYTAYYDDWVISNDYVSDFPIGAHHVESLIPTADGTHAVGSGAFDSFTGTSFTNGTTNGNTFIGHRPLQLANTANQVIRQVSNDVTAYMEFTLENLAAGASTPFAVRTYGAAMEAGTGNSVGAIKLLLSTNVEVLTDGSLSVIDAGDSISNTAVSVFKREAIDPSGGWDRTKVDGLKIRLGFADGAPDVNFIDVMVEVALSEPATDATPSTVAAPGAAVGTPTITLGTTALPDTVAGVATVATPAVQMSAVATPAVIAAVAAVATPSAIAGGAASANPSTITAVAAVPTPTVTAITPTTFPDFYSDGYGQGYETITAEPPVVVAPEPPLVLPTPTLRVLIDFQNDISPASGPQPFPAWVDVTSLLLARPVTIARGRKRLMDRIEAGQLSLVFSDMERVLDPSNLDSPFYPGVGPDRRIRIEAVIPWETDAFTQCASFVGDDDIVGGGSTFHYLSLFDGLIDEMTYDFPGPSRFATVTVRCSDVLALASRDQVATNIPATYLHVAFESVLDTRAYMGRDAETPVDPNTPSALRRIDEDFDTLVAAIPVLASLSEPLAQLTASGGGNFYIGRDGMPTYRSRAAFVEPPKAAFAIDAERFHDVQFSFDNALVVNDVIFNGFTTQNQPSSIHLVDEASKQHHPARPTLTVDTVLSDVNVLTDRAREVLANQAAPVRYVARLDVSQVSTDWLTVLALDLWDRIDLSVVLPNGDVIRQPSLIEGIDITTNSLREWYLTWWLSVPPFGQMFTEEDASFEDGTVGGWTAETNCTISATATQFTLNNRNYYHSNTIPLSPPHGAYALRAEGVVAGDMFIQSGAYAIEGRVSYAAEVKVSRSRFLSDETETADWTTKGPYRMDIEWYDASMSLLSTDFGTDTTFPGQSTSFSGLAQTANWNSLVLQRRAPSGASFLRIRVGWTGDTLAAFYMDDGLLTRIVS